jgi:hypothetical protein
MPIIKPYGIEKMTSLMEDIEMESKSKNQSRNASREIFNNRGLTLEAAAAHVHNLLQNGEESTRVKMLDTVLKVHGALEPEKEEAKHIEFNIQFVNVTNPAGVASILIPRE